MTVADLITMLQELAPLDAVIVAHDGGHDADEVPASGINVVFPGQAAGVRPFDISDDAVFVRIV